MTDHPENVRGGTPARSAFIYLASAGARFALTAVPIGTSLTAHDRPDRCDP
jgi:hypothetical protein